MQISVEGGKYTFVLNGGNLKILRYEEPWMNVQQGSKAIIAMMYELEEARECKNI